MIGLNEKESHTIRGILSKYPEVEEAVLFGSRARGDNKLSSDVDFAVKGKNLSSRVIARLWDELSESDFPYFVDIVNYQTITNPALKENIDSEGFVFYIKH